MTAEQFRQTALRLFGPERGWQTRCADALGTDRASVSRWVAGGVEVPGPVQAAISAMKKIEDLKRAANAKAWALGHQQGNGFQVRRVVWGKLMAREERREGEEIRHAVIFVGRKHSP